MARGRKSDLHHATNMYNEDLEREKDIFIEKATTKGVNAEDCFPLMDMAFNKNEHIEQNIKKIRELRKYYK